MITSAFVIPEVIHEFFLNKSLGMHLNDRANLGF